MARAQEKHGAAVVALRPASLISASCTSGLVWVTGARRHGIGCATKRPSRRRRDERRIKQLLLTCGRTGTPVATMGPAVYLHWYLQRLVMGGMKQRTAGLRRLGLAATPRVGKPAASKFNVITFRPFTSDASRQRLAGAVHGRGWSAGKGPDRAITARGAAAPIQSTLPRWGSPSPGSRVRDMARVKDQTIILSCGERSSGERSIESVRA